MKWKILAKIKNKKPIERRQEIIEALFKNRGLKTKKQREEFLTPKNPYQLTPKEVGITTAQLKKAIIRIKKAVKNKEEVVVYGDYDTDGVCATAIMWETLYQLGAKVMPFIPKREEGYGLKIERINQMAEKGVSLIITVDQGIVHSKQVAHARRLGIDVIITDHHLSEKKTPQAEAIVHTTKLSGSGVAWFLAKEIGSKPDLDLVTIGTITDVIPLVGPNRSLVKFGLREVRKTKRLGLLALYDFAGLNKKNIGTYEIGFIIGPRLNAAGRMDDPMESLRLVCTQNENRAIGLAQKIDQKNRERQSLTNQTILHARELWLKEDGQSSLIFINHQSYEQGVIGLVAGKLKDEFYRPAIILAPRQNHWVASARSIEEFNIVEAIRLCADLLESHGGHPLAAGFTIIPEKVEEMRKRLLSVAAQQLDKEKLRQTLKIEAEIELKDLSFEFYHQIQKFAPFGMGNPQPIFATRKVKVLEARTVGSKGQHLKLRFTNFNAIGFNLGNFYTRLSPERLIDIAYSLLLDEWNNQKRLQLKLKDIKIK